LPGNQQGHRHIFQYGEFTQQMMRLVNKPQGFIPYLASFAAPTSLRLTPSKTTLPPLGFSRPPTDGAKCFCPNLMRP